MKNFVAAAGVDVLAGVKVLIRPVTSATARELGIKVTVQAREFTIDGRVEVLLNSF